MKRMRNVVPYVVMVTGLTAVFVWAKWKQAEGREVGPCPSCLPAPAADGIMLIDVRTPEEFHARHRDGAVNIPVDEVETLAPQLVPDKNTLLLFVLPYGQACGPRHGNPEKMGYSRVEEFAPPGYVGFLSETVKRKLEPFLLLSHSFSKALFFRGNHSLPRFLLWP